MASKKRVLRIKMERVSGTVNQFLAWLNGYPVIGPGTPKNEWKGTVPEKVHLETVVYGQGSAKYKLTIDLPGTAKDQSLVLQLTKGYHCAEYDL